MSSLLHGFLSLFADHAENTEKEGNQIEKQPSPKQSPERPKTDREIQRQKLLNLRSAEPKPLLQDSLSTDSGELLSEWHQGMDEPIILSPRSILSEQSQRARSESGSSAGSMVIGEIGITNLMEAARKNLLRLGRVLLSNIEDPNEPEETLGLAAPHVAAQAGNLEFVQLLDEFQVNLEAQDHDGQTPLHYACFGGEMAVVEYLCTQYGSVDTADMDGVTPFMQACERRHEHVALLLIMYMTDRELHNTASSKLHIAATAGLPLVVEALLDVGVNVNGFDHDGNTALHLATINTNFSCIQVLLNNGADTSLTNRDGLTAFALACVNRTDRVALAIVEFLENRSPHVLNSTDRGGYTYLHWAANGGLFKTCTFLVEKCDVDIDAVALNGATPLWIFMSSKTSDDERMTKLFVGHGANILAKDFNEGLSCLQMAYKNAKEHSLKCFAKHFKKTGYDLCDKDFE